MAHEHLNKMNRKADIIAEQALEALNRHGVKGKWQRAARPNGPDGKVDLILPDKSGHQLFIAEVKHEVRTRTIPGLLDQAHTTGDDKPFIVIAEYIQPAVKEQLRAAGIAYLDIYGNCYIKAGGALIWLDNQKTHDEIKTTKPKRVFHKAGLKVIFHFLLNEKLVNAPYRTIAEEADVALGNLNYIIHGLMELRFLAMKNKKEYILINKKELLEKWVEAYGERLKPDLFTGNFRFARNIDFDSWRDLQLNYTVALWGGEAAGDIYTNYLRPEKLTLYTNEARGELMKHYRLVPEENGNVAVYKMFWQNKNNEEAVPPILAYADLINTGNPRCIETAKKIYEDYIRHTVE